VAVIDFIRNFTITCNCKVTVKLRTYITAVMIVSTMMMLRGSSSVSFKKASFIVMMMVPLLWLYLSSYAYQQVRHHQISTLHSVRCFHHRSKVTSIDMTMSLADKISQGLEVKFKNDDIIRVKSCWNNFAKGHPSSSYSL